VAASVRQQQATNSGTGIVSGSSGTVLASAVLAGSTLIMCIVPGAGSNAATVTSVSGFGATWSRVIQYATAPICEIWVGYNPTAGSGSLTVTLNPNNSNSKWVAWGLEIPGGAAVFPTSNHSTSASPSITMNRRVGWVSLAWVNAETAVTVNPGSPWTVGDISHDFSDTNGATGVYLVGAANTTQAATWTIGASELWTTVGCLVAPAVGPLGFTRRPSGLVVPRSVRPRVPPYVTPAPAVTTGPLGPRILRPAPSSRRPPAAQVPPLVPVAPLMPPPGPRVQRPAPPRARWPRPGLIIPGAGPMGRPRTSRPPLPTIRRPAPQPARLVPVAPLMAPLGPRVRRPELAPVRRPRPGLVLRAATVAVVVGPLGPRVRRPELAPVRRAVARLILRTPVAPPLGPRVLRPALLVVVRRPVPRIVLQTPVAPPLRPRAQRPALPAIVRSRVVLVVPSSPVPVVLVRVVRYPRGLVRQAPRPQVVPLIPTAPALPPMRSPTRRPTPPSRVPPGPRVPPITPPTPPPTGGVFIFLFDDL
jgi:hypothetical protein